MNYLIQCDETDLVFRSKEDAFKAKQYIKENWNEQAYIAYTKQSPTHMWEYNMPIKIGNSIVQKGKVDRCAYNMNLDWYDRTYI